MGSAKIMVVEDERIVARDLQRNLKKLGYDVPAVVSSGEEAVRKTEEIRPDLVLMDIVLKGGMDGVEAAEQIYSRFGVPVVFLTAYSDDSTLERAKVTEPFGYIIKPFRMRELRSSIEIALHKHKSERRLGEKVKWLDKVLRSITGAVIVTDSCGLVTFMSSNAEPLTGWKREDALGKGLGEILKIKGNKTGALDLLNKVLREGCFISPEKHVVLTAKNEAQKSVCLSFAPIRDDPENVSGAVILLSNVIERRGTESKIPDVKKPKLEFDGRGKDAPVSLVLVSSAFAVDGIRKIIESEKEVEVVSESSNCLEIIPLVERVKPDVLFIDTAMPGFDVLESMESIKRKSAETNVILLIHALDDEFIIRAVSSGVRGFLTDASNAGQFVQAVKAVFKGEIWLEIKALTRIITRLLPVRDNLRLSQSNLTSREEEVARLVVQGYGNRQISEKLLISENTVKNHLTNIFNKYGVRSRSQLLNILGRVVL